MEWFGRKPFWLGERGSELSSGDENTYDENDYVYLFQKEKSFIAISSNYVIEQELRSLFSNI